jgi:hypothetical protein
MRILFVLVAAAGLLCAADTKYGKPLTMKQPIPLATLLAHADDYNGKTVQVKAKVTEVCRQLLDACAVSDINVQELPVEEVIRQLFGERSEQNNLEPRAEPVA